MSNAIKQALTATGPSDAANVRVCDLVISGVFVGTWQFQVQMNGAWETVAQGTDIGGAYLDIEFAEPRQVRVNVSAYTSGSIGVSLAGHAYGCAH